MKQIFTVKRLRRFAAHLARQFWTMVFVLVIFVAVTIQLCRQAFPLLDDYKEQIAAVIGAQLGVQVSLGGIEASWQGLRPKLSMADMRVQGELDAQVLAVRKASAELSLVDSALQRRWVWRNISFEDLEIHFLQGANNRWTLSGVSPLQQSDKQFDIDDPLDMFLLGRLVEIRDSKIMLFYQDGSSAFIHAPEIIIENDKDFHRLQVKVNVDEQREAIYAVVEAEGDPRNLESFSQRGYVSLTRFGLAKVVSIWGEQAASKLQERFQWHQDSFLDAQLWFTGTPSQGLDFRGSLSATELCAEEACAGVPNFVNADFSGSWQYQQAWRLDLFEPKLEWNRQVLPKSDLSFYGDVSRGVRLGLRTREADSASWMKFLRDTTLIEKLPKTASKALQALQPAGLLSDVHLALTDPERGNFRLSAKLDGGAVQSFRGSPIAEGVNGHVYVQGSRGLFDLDVDEGISLHFDKVYTRPLEFKTARGKVAWQVDKDADLVYVASDLLEVQASDHRGFGLLFLQLPMKNDGREPKMSLAIRVPEIAAKHHLTYVPEKVPDTLRTWLKNRHP